jgi:acetyl-CoA acetyltransferase
MDKFESKVVISGIGMSEIGRRLMRQPLSLTVDACLAAVADAGLTLADVDGLSTYPGGGPEGGHSEGGVPAIVEALGIRPNWFNGTVETSGQGGSVITGALAVAAGLARHVLCFRTVWEATHTELLRQGRIRPPRGNRIGGEMQWRMPYGANSAANWIGMLANRHMHEYGTTREQLGALAVNNRANAGRTPYAVYKDPITLDDYLSARTITTPFGLYDCDVPCDGSVAVVISHVDTVPDLPKPPVRFEAVGTRITERYSWDQGVLDHEPMVQGPAEHLWSRTDLRPADVDCAQLYDGFSFNALTWLEALGFCGKGEGGPFLEGGGRIARDGELPMNTNGGQLSGGRLHGYGFIHEAVVQLRGEGGERQLPTRPEVALASFGGGHPGGCLLLTR